jgi:hypothetical protein
MNIVKRILIVFGVIVVILIVLGGFFGKRKINNGRGVFSSPESVNCKNVLLPQFSHHITEMEDVTLVQPGGGVEKYGNKNIIKSHSYIVVDGEVPIYAPTDSLAFEGANYMEEGMEQYSVFFQVTCDVFYLFDHIHKPVDKLKNEFTRRPTEDSRTFSIGPIEFSGGELIGYTTGTMNAHHFDFGLFDMTKHNPYTGYTNIVISERDYWSICPFDNFPQNMRIEYTSHFGTIRSQDPIPTSICK